MTQHACLKYYAKRARIIRQFIKKERLKNAALPNIKRNHLENILVQLMDNAVSTKSGMHSHADTQSAYQKPHPPPTLDPHDDFQRMFMKIENKTRVTIGRFYPNCIGINSNNSILIPFHASKLLICGQIIPSTSLYALISWTNLGNLTRKLCNKTVY